MLYLFRNRIRQYPALVNCTTINWFSEWPRDALLEVAERCLDGLSLGSENGVRHINKRQSNDGFINVVSVLQNTKMHKEIFWVD